MKYYGLLAILVFFSSSIHAANCIPKVTDKKVTIEYFDGKGNIVRSETHKVRSKKKYKGLVSNEKAFKKLEKDKTGNIKIRSGKLDLKSGGMTTRVSKRDGTSLAKIGGCPVSTLKFYKKIGKAKSPFIHISLIEAATKVEVQPASNETSKSATAPNILPETAGDEGIRSKDDHSGQTLYGWLDRVSYSQTQNQLLQGAPLKYSDTQVDIGVYGVTTRVSRAIKCNAVVLDRALPKIGGMPVGDLKGKSPRDVDAAFNKYRGAFLKLSNVQIYEIRNQKFCIPSSIDVVMETGKTNVKFPEVRNQYLTRAFDVIIRSGMGLTDAYFHLNPAGSNLAGIGPEEYDCNQYQWSTAEAAKRMGEEFQRRNIQGLKTADVEFVGVRPVLNNIARCEFDAMRVTANQQE